MTTLAELVVKVNVDTKNLTKATKANDRLARSAQQIKKAYVPAAQEIERFDTKAKTSATGLDKVAAASTKAGRTAKGLQGALGGLVSSGQGVAMIMNGDIIGGLLQMEGGFGRAALGAAKFAKAAGQAVASFIADMARAVATMVVNAAQVVAGWVLMGVEALLNAAKIAAAWLISLGPIALVIAAVVAIAVAVVKYHQQIWETIQAVWGAIRRFLEAVGSAILNAIKGAWNAVWGTTKSIFNGIMNFLKRWWPLLLGVFGGPLGLLVGLVVKNWGAIERFTVSIFNGVVGFFAGLPGRIWRAISWLASGLGMNLAAAFGAIVNLVKWVVNSAIWWFGNMPRGIWNALRGLGALLWGIFKGAINAVIDAWNRIKFPTININAGPLHLKFGGFKLPQIPRLAKGGIVTSPTLALIGEAGPEAIVPLSGRGARVPVPAPAEPTKIIFDFIGANSEFARFVRKMVRVDGKGLAQGAFGG